MAGREVEQQLCAGRLWVEDSRSRAAAGRLRYQHDAMRLAGVVLRM